MAEVTKRKLTAIYSMVVGFFLSLFSGQAHAGAMFYTKSTTLNKTSSSSKGSPVRINPSPAREMAPAPEENSSIVPSVGREMIPAPNSGQSLEDAEVKSISTIEDSSMRNFIYQKAVEQGKNPDQLTTQDFNTLRTDYLEVQVKNLEQQLQQLNGQNLSH